MAINYNSPQVAEVENADYVLEDMPFYLSEAVPCAPYPHKTFEINAGNIERVKDFFRARDPGKKHDASRVEAANNATYKYQGPPKGLFFIVLFQTLFSYCNFYVMQRQVTNTRRTPPYWHASVQAASWRIWQSRPCLDPEGLLTYLCIQDYTSLLSLRIPAIASRGTIQKRDRRPRALNHTILLSFFQAQEELFPPRHTLIDFLAETRRKSQRDVQWPDRTPLFGSPSRYVFLFIIISESDVTHHYFGVRCYSKQGFHQKLIFLSGCPSAREGFDRVF